MAQLRDAGVHVEHASVLEPESYLPVPDHHHLGDPAESQTESPGS